MNPAFKLPDVAQAVVDPLAAAPGRVPGRSIPPDTDLFAPSMNRTRDESTSEAEAALLSPGSDARRRDSGEGSKTRAKRQSD